MNISIAMIRVNSISSIGSLNIGKTIICKNESSSIAYNTTDGMQPPLHDGAFLPADVLPLLHDGASLPPDVLPPTLIGGAMPDIGPTPPDIGIIPPVR